MISKRITFTCLGMCHQTRYANSYLQLRWLRCRKNAGMMVVNGTRDNEQKLKDRRLPLKIRENFSTVRVTQHWHSLPREIVESPFLEMFKNPLDIVLGNRCKWPCFSGEVGADDSQRFLPNLTTLVLWFYTFVPLFFFHSTSSTANGGIPPLANSCTFTSHDCFKRNSETVLK